MSKRSNKHTISCGTVVWRERENAIELLLIRQYQDLNVWGIPKGKISKRESHEECAIRETKEETGLLVALTHKLIDVKNEAKNKTIISYLATSIDELEPSCDDPDCEVFDVNWFRCDNLPKIFDYQLPIIEDALHKIKILGV